MGWDRLRWFGMSKKMGSNRFERDVKSRNILHWVGVDLSLEWVGVNWNELEWVRKVSNELLWIAMNWNKL